MTQNTRVGSMESVGEDVMADSSEKRLPWQKPKQPDTTRLDRLMFDRTPRDQAGARRIQINNVG